MARFVLALVGLGIAAFFYVEAQTYPKAAAQLPSLIAIVVGLLSLFMIAETAWARRRQVTQRHKPSAGDVRLPDRRGLLRAGLFAAATVLYVWAIEPLGYLIATPLFLMACLLSLRALRPALAVVVTALSVATVYAVFIVLLNLPMPLIFTP